MVVKIKKERRGISAYLSKLEQKAYWRVKRYLKQIWEKDSWSEERVWAKVGGQRRLNEPRKEKRTGCIRWEKIEVKEVNHQLIWR